MKKPHFSKKQINTVVILILGIVMSYFGFAQKDIRSVLGNLEAIEPGYYKVVDFSDGDTITVDMNGSEETIRFIGVDTPETQHPSRPVQCFGERASEFTKQLIGNNNVKLEADPTNTNRDRYNRLLRYVYLPDSTLVNAKIIEEGYGFAYIAFPFEKKSEFVQLQNQARQQNKGLWSDCEIEQDGEYQSTNDDNQGVAD